MIDVCLAQDIFNKRFYVVIGGYHIRISKFAYRKLNDILYKNDAKEAIEMDCKEEKHGTDLQSRID